MISSILRHRQIEDILKHLRDALIDSLNKTGYAHFNIDCEIIDRPKGIVRVRLAAGATQAFNVSRREISARRTDLHGEGGRTKRIISHTEGNPIEEILNHLRIALIDGVTKTGYAHLELDCSVINRDKGIIRVELTAGTKYSFTVSRKEISAYSKVKSTESARPNRLGS